MKISEPRTGTTQLLWQIQQAPEEMVAHLREVLNIHPVLCKFLVLRGIETYDQAKEFFRPAMDMLHDPFLMKDMDRAVERIMAAMANKEGILVYGDYDVDGTTAIALVFSFLKKVHPGKLEYYVPDRYKEGYGISIRGVDYASENGFHLIVALDCGIKAIEQVDHGGRKGIDFIICDHHLPGPEIPEAVAVLDPKREDCRYPYKELSGCGLGYKFMQAVCRKMDIPGSELEELLPFVALSIGCDIVPITGENRLLAYFGLKRINTSPTPGLKSLIEISGIKGEITITDLVFGLGPRINAAGRMEDAANAVKLLIADDPDLSEVHALKLNKNNSDRKHTDTAITEQALKMLIDDPEAIHRKSTVLFHHQWHKGVIGIVASRLIEKFYRPTIVFTESEDLIVGSARSVAGFNIYEALSACSDLMVKFGGHQFAAGLSIKKEDFPVFKERFEQVVSASITEKSLYPVLAIDAEIELNDIGDSFFRILRQFAPFGPGNMKPVFLARNVRDSGYSKIVGENHLKLSVRQSNSRNFGGIAFNMGDKIREVKNKTFDLCFTIEENVFNGQKSLQLNVKDLKPTL